MAQDNRLYDTGDQVEDLEVVSVSYKESEENGRFGFVYTMVSKTDLDAARKAEKEHEAELKKAQEEAEEKAKRDAEEEAAHRNTEVDEQE